jgi:hypothetical protein
VTPRNGTTKAMSLRSLNNLRNGARIIRLALGELPPCLHRVTRYCRQYRKILEVEVAQANGGEVSLTAAHWIDCAAGHEQHLQLMRWLLRERLENMTISDVVKCSSAMASARDARNRAVAQLGLDRDSFQDAINSLYKLPAPKVGEHSDEPQ